MQVCVINRLFFEDEYSSGTECDNTNITITNIILKLATPLMTNAYHEPSVLKCTEL